MLELRVERQLGSFRLEADFACDSAGIVAFFGRSGAGKTTLINLLAGLERPDRGRIVLNGKALFDSDRGLDLPPEKRRLGYVFQEGRLFPHLSVEGNLKYGYNRVPVGERRVELDQMTSLLGLQGLLRRKPRDLSGGEKQRVALGRALLANPRLLLMDEPLAALDQPLKDEVLPFIERLRDEFAIPIVYVSHSMQEIVRLADTLVLMSEGQVVAVGTLEELTSRLDLRPLTGRYEAGAVLAARVEAHIPEDGLTRLSFGGGELLVPVVDLPLGHEIRVRIRARDVALALRPPVETSFLNVIASTVEDIGTEDGPQVDLRLRSGDAALWARITARSLKALDLRPGTAVFALVKAVAIDRQSLGRGTQGRFMPQDDEAAKSTQADGGGTSEKVVR